jgi:glucose-1-phosphate cytidylyltransferase
MKAVILAGGLGTRLSEETDLKPKPMVEIGGRPILWHIMKIYSTHGINDFIICCGYKGYVIKEYFANYFLHMSDIRFSIKDNLMTVIQNNAEPWTVTLVDTGDMTGTGGRLKRVRDHLQAEEPFCFTYGDGVADVDISKLIDFHNGHGKLVSITATRPPGRFGALGLGESDSVERFQEKPEGDGSWINGGFFVLSIGAIDFVEHEQDSWESGALARLASIGEVRAFKHHGFWQPMDTLRERNLLIDMWQKGTAPWKIWN